MSALPGECGAVAEWSKALAWKVSIRQNRIEGSNPSRSATLLRAAATGSEHGSKSAVNYIRLDLPVSGKGRVAWRGGMPAFDGIVIGGGFYGCEIALELKRL